jgi:hypothetical protein
LIIFSPRGFIDEQLHSLPKLVAPSQLQPALFKAKVIGTQFFVLNSLSLTSAFFGALVTLAEYFTEVLKQRFLPSEAASILDQIVAPNKPMRKALPARQKWLSRSSAQPSVYRKLSALQDFPDPKCR